MRRWRKEQSQIRPCGNLRGSGLVVSLRRWPITNKQSRIAVSSGMRSSSSGVAAGTAPRSLSVVINYQAAESCGFVRQAGATLCVTVRELLKQNLQNSDFLGEKGQFGQRE